MVPVCFYGVCISIDIILYPNDQVLENSSFNRPYGRYKMHEAPPGGCDFD